MIPEVGHFALVLALALAAIQSVAPVVGARSDDAALMRLGNSTALMQFVFVAMSFAVLTACYIRSDFSVVAVFENSHSAMPLIYKFSSVWGNHEGPMLLWVRTLYPLALEAITGAKISVGAPFFNLTFAPPFVPLMFAMPFGQLLAWKRGNILGVAQRLLAALGISLGAADLFRRCRNDVRRRAVAIRSAIARRGAEAGCEDGREVGSAIGGITVGQMGARGQG